MTPNIFEPVVVNVALRAATTVNDIRGTLFVSRGHTKKDVGSVLLVTSNNYNELATGNELKDRLKAYFITNGNNMNCHVLEVGNTGVLDEVEILKNVVSEGLVPCYSIACPNAWYSAICTTWRAYDETKPSLFVAANSIKIAKNSTLKIEAHYLGDDVSITPVQEGIATLSLDNETSELIVSPESVGQTSFDVSVTQQNTDGTTTSLTKTIIVQVLDSGTDEVSGQILENIEKRIVSPLAELAREYSNATDKHTFFVTSGIAIPSVDGIYDKFKGLKSMAVVYPNLEGDGVGAVVGKIDSYFYDETANMKSLEMKAITGFNAKNLTENEKSMLVGTNLFYFANNSVTQIGGGKCCDGVDWEAYFGLDSTINAIKSSFANMVMAKVNSSPSEKGLSFTDENIKMGANELKEQLKKALNKSWISEFGKNFSLDGSIVDSNDVYAEAVASYKKTHPTEYAKHIYSGYSVAIKSSKFVKFILINFDFEIAK